MKTKRFFVMLLVLVMILGMLPMAVSAAEIEATLSFESKANRIEYDTAHQIWRQNRIVFTNNKGSSASDVSDSVNPVRVSAGSEMTIEYPNMTKIHFVCESRSYAGSLYDSIGTLSDATVSKNDSNKTVTITFNSRVNSFKIAKLSGQVRIQSLTVTGSPTAGAYSVSKDGFVISAEFTCKSCKADAYIDDIVVGSVTNKKNVFEFDDITVHFQCFTCGEADEICFAPVVTVSDCTKATTHESSFFHKSFDIKLTVARAAGTHSSGKTHTVNATCVSEGKKYNEACSLCGIEQIIETYPIDPDAHNVDKAWTKDSKQHYHACKNGCGTKLDAVNHSWNNGVCSVCEYVCVHSYKNGKCTLCDVICSHEYELSETHFAPGCDYEGFGTYTCKICKMSYQAGIPVKHGDVILRGDNGDGTHSFVCKDCGDVMEKEAHSFEDGYCTVCKSLVPDPVAVVSKNGVITGYYADLQEAFDKVNECEASDNAIVKLIRDVDVGDGFIKVSSKAVTFDLNGKTLSGQKSDYVLYLYDKNEKVRRFTIEDSATGGAILATGMYGVYAPSAADVFGTSYTLHLTINGGKISGTTYGVCSDITSGEVVINGGFITGVRGYGSPIIINNGNITTGSKFKYALFNTNAIIKINGGTVDGVIYAVSCEINGGTFSGGIEINGPSLRDSLGKGMAYWLNGRMLTGYDYAKIAGGDVVVKPICTHDSYEKIDFTDNNNTTHTYTLTCCYNTGKEEHSWDEYNHCEYCYVGKPFKFSFTDGDKTLYEKSVKAGDYYSFNAESDKDGLTFLGWDEDGDGVADYAGVDLPYYYYVEGDMTFNAVYGDVYLIRYYRIGLDSGEYEISNIQQYPENGVLSLDYDYAYWYNPLGWATEPYGEKVYNYGEEITVTGTLDLYTVYEPFIITFDLGEGASWVDETGDPIPESITMDETFYTAPTKPGYKFKHFTTVDQYGNELTYEFYTDDETGEKWMPVSVVGKMTLTAVWEECTEHSYVDGACEYCGRDEYLMVIFETDKKVAVNYTDEYGEMVSDAYYAIVENEGTLNLSFTPLEGYIVKSVTYAGVTFPVSNNEVSLKITEQDAITVNVEKIPSVMPAIVSTEVKTDSSYTFEESSGRSAVIYIKLDGGYGYNITERGGILSANGKFFKLPSAVSDNVFGVRVISPAFEAEKNYSMKSYISGEFGEIQGEDVVFTFTE